MATSATPPNASEQLHARCLQAMKEEHKIQLQLEALQLKLKKLRRHGKSLDTKADATRTATEDAMLAYARNVCLEFCTKVYQTFPREIRDCIYGYITGCENVMISELPSPSGSRRGSRVSYFDSSCETQFRHQSLILDSDHWWLADFVGDKMVRELGEYYYRISYFQFTNSLDVIPDFRLTDQWKLGFLPVSFVSNVEVSIKWNGDNFLDYIGDTRNEDGDGWDPWGAVRSEGGSNFLLLLDSSLLIRLESLFGFRTGTALTINIYMDRYKDLKDFEKLEMMKEILVPVIFPTLQRLKDAGLKVRIVLTTVRTCEWFQGKSRKFTSTWNPVSTEEITKSYLEYVDNEKAKDRALELHYAENEDFHDYESE